MMVVMQLYLCEKPSQAKDIAAVLGAKRRGDGCWLGTGVTVTWCIGHLLETAPPDAYDARYKRWVLADLPIIPEKWKMTVKPRTASQYKAVKRLLGEASELVIATDADREGEMIARELVEHCRYRGPIRRLWLSALDDASIRKALAALKPGAETFSLYHSALRLSGCIAGRSGADADLAPGGRSRSQHCRFRPGRLLGDRCATAARRHRVHRPMARGLRRLR
jgi:DNA topoisomerase-3